MYKSLRAQTLHYFARPQAEIRRSPLDIPAAWRGDALRQDSSWTCQLTSDDIAELNDALKHAQASGKPMGRLGRTDFPLPSLHRKVGAWRDEVRHGRGFVRVRGLPVNTWSETESATVYWCIGQHLGLPGAQNPQGDLLGHVRDQRTGEDVRLYRTSHGIDVHTDAADIVGLLCLKSAKSGGLSRLVSSVTVYNELLARHPKMIERLYRPFYFDTKGEGGIRAFPIAPCAYADGELRTFWQSDYYRSAERVPGVPALSDADRAVLDAYEDIANDPSFYLDMELAPGDMQLVSNHTILHARTAFEDWPEAERRRHLLRLWISLPERRPLRIRWLTARSWLDVTYSAARQLIRSRLAA